jgi:hypothetical protein
MVFIKEESLKHYTMGCLENHVTQVAELVREAMSSNFGCGECPDFYAEAIATWPDKALVLTSREEIWEVKLRSKDGVLSLVKPRKLDAPVMESAELNPLDAEQLGVVLTEAVNAAIRRK